MTATGLDRCRVAAAGLDHPEGLCFDGDGVLWAGGEAGQVYRVDLEAGTAEQVASTGGFLLGMAADGAGRLHLCDVARRELLLLDPTTGALSVRSAGAPGRPLVNPNWPAFDADGRLYLTDSGSWHGDDGCVLVVEPDGSTAVWTEETAGFPNGCCLVPDGSALLVAESTTPALVRVPVLPDGSAGPREVVAELPGTVPDGVSVDEQGRAYVACYRPDRVLRVDPDGRVEVLADDPQGTLLAAPTNGAWTPSLDRMVVGNLGRWHLTECDWGARGVPLHRPVLP